MRTKLCRRIIALLILLLAITQSALANPDIELKLITIHGDREITIKDNIKVLSLYKGDIAGISGLGKLARLRKMLFRMPGFIRDYSFVEESKSIEILAFDECRIESLAFLKKLTHLRILSFESCSIPSLELDISGNPNLEFLRMNNVRIIGSSDRIKDAPRLIGVGPTLQYIDLSFNEITTLPDTFLDRTRKVGLILIGGNSLDSYRERVLSDLDNIAIDYNELRLPEKYRSKSIWEGEENRIN